MWSYHGFTPYHSCCGCGQHGQGQPVPSPWWTWYAAWQPHWHSQEPERFPSSHVAEELTADSTTTTANAVAGGAEPVHLSLEYEADSGASSPTVTVTITDSSGTASWNLAGFPAGYHVKRELARVEPGAQLKLQVSGTTAHLRWFEFVF